MNNFLFKKTFYYLLALLIPSSIFGQNITFKKIFGHQSTDARYAIETPNGYLIAGMTSKTNVTTNFDGYLLSINKAGDIQWSKNYGGNKSEILSIITKATEHDGYILAGYADETNTSNVDAWIVRVDTLGATIWEKRYGVNQFREVPNLNAPIISLNDGYVYSIDVSKSVWKLGSVIMKTSHNGDLLWNYLYTFNNNPDSNSIKKFNIGHSDASFLYGTGINGNNAVFFTLNQNDGKVSTAIEFSHPEYAVRSQNLLEAKDGNFFLTGTVVELNSTTNLNMGKWIWIAKVTPQGQLLWSKIIPSKFIWELTPLKWTLTTNGDIIGCAKERVSGSFSDMDYIQVLKIDSQGSLYSKKVLSLDTTTLYQEVNHLIQTSDGGFMGVGSYLADDSVYLHAALIKTDSLFDVQDCCSKNRELVSSIDFPIEVNNVPYTQSDYLSTSATNLIPLFTADFKMYDACFTPQPYLTRTVSFCPGDTVWINGLPYTQADTLENIRLASTEYCDTLATFILKYNTEGVFSSLTAKCPDNQTIIAPPGMNSAPVSYNEPWSITDCPCPETTNTLVNGMASGDFFPIGTTNVCYRIEDACGSAQTCCFDINILPSLDPETSCDEKTSGCVMFELAQISKNSVGNWIYRIRVTNNCPDPVRYAYFEVSDGIQALAPTTNSGYISPSGNSYIIRNPNFSPFYSIRFQPSNSNFLANGATETFRYEVPAQAALLYIHAAIRHLSGAYSETYLNTFSCDVSLEKQDNDHMSSNRTEDQISNEAISVFPNPLLTGNVLNIRTFKEISGTFSLYDITGSKLFVEELSNAQVQLPELLNGAYLYKIEQSGHVVSRGKLMIAH
ncbi:MAG TPA: HYR domain-containing protein [Saprospiraceae bacterium]|nr:HYR domain-containing protein [Saprospiraceae bacterium]